MMARMGLTTSIRVGLIVAACITASACGVRLETPDPVWPSPDATVVERDSAALTEQWVLDAARGGDDAFALWQQEAARQRLDMWGGVYLAFPDDVYPPSEDTVTDATITARNRALEIALSQPGLGHDALATSAALSHAVGLWWSRAEHGVELGLTMDEIRVALVDGVPPPTTSEIAPTTLSATAVAVDQAAYLYEVIAARSSGDDRAWAFARRAELVATASMLVDLSGGIDNREAVYSVDTTTVTGTAALGTISQTELALAHTYTVLAIEHPADRPWLLNLAFDHYHVALATTPASWESIPALPGLVTE